MIEREMRDRVQRQSVPVAVICDRCEQNLRRIVGGTRTEWEGTFMEGALFPSRNLAEAEYFEAQLCDICTLELQQWIAG